jgi:hypothetical protein
MMNPISIGCTVNWLQNVDVTAGVIAMQKDDLINKMAKDVWENRCENVEGSMKRMLYSVCRTPAIGPALPICVNHAYVGQ